MTHDPFQDFFDAVDPVKDLSDAQLEALHPEANLIDRLRAETRKESVGGFRQKVLRRSVVVTVATVFVLAGTAAAVALLRSPAQVTTSLSCFRTDSLRNGADVIAYSQSSLAACQSLMQWAPVPSSPSPDGSLCVLSNGSLAAFPPSRETQVCSKLGLSDFNGSVKNPAVGAFRRATQQYFLDHRCSAPATALAGIQRLIGQFGITDWHLRMRGSRRLSACATLAIDVKSKTVEIVGISG